MRITCTGHAGIFIETATSSILCDPWRSPAYFASWFVFPDNSNVDFTSLHPDYLYISHLHRDHFDPRLLEAAVPKTATVLLPDFPTDDLRDSLSELGFSSFLQTHNGEPLEVDGLRLMVVSVTSPNDGPLGDSALAVDDGEVKILNQNDARPRDWDPIDEFGPYDGHFVQYSGAIWWPVAYELAPATKRALAARKRADGMLRATRFIEKVGASSVFPNSGPPAFLDEDLFGYNDLSNSDDNPFPDQTVFIDYLAERGHDNARLLIPGSVAELKQRCPSTDDDENLGCKISHPLPDEDVRSIFTDKKRYLEAYAERERPRIDMERLSWPRYKGSLTEALAEWWNPLLALADHIGPGVGGPVLLEIGEEKVVIDFPAREVRKWVGEECNYRFAVESELVEALVAEH